MNTPYNMYSSSIILNTLNAAHEDVAKKFSQLNVILNLIQMCYNQDILISSQTHEAPRTKAWECSNWRTEKWLQVWERTGQPWLNSQHCHPTSLVTSLCLVLTKNDQGFSEGSGVIDLLPLPLLSSTLTPAIAYPSCILKLLWSTTNPVDSEVGGLVMGLRWQTAAGGSRFGDVQWEWGLVGFSKWGVE